MWSRSSSAKDARGDRVYADVMRDSYAQTVVAPYSVRARRGAPVATPLHWAEAEDASLTPARFTLRTLGERLSATPDPVGRHVPPPLRRGRRPPPPGRHHPLAAPRRPRLAAASAPAPSRRPLSRRPLSRPPRPSLRAFTRKGAIACTRIPAKAPSRVPGQPRRGPFEPYLGLSASVVPIAPTVVCGESRGPARVRPAWSVRPGGRWPGNFRGRNGGWLWRARPISGPGVAGSSSARGS